MTVPPRYGVLRAVALTHDLVRGRSIVTLEWSTDPERRLALPVPFGCTLEAVAAEATIAIRGFTGELSTVAVVAAPQDDVAS